MLHNMNKTGIIATTGITYIQVLIPVLSRRYKGTVKYEIINVTKLQRNKSCEITTL